MTQLIFIKYGMKSMTLIYFQKSISTQNHTNLLLNTYEIPFRYIWLPSWISNSIKNHTTNYAANVCHKYTQPSSTASYINHIHNFTRSYHIRELFNLRLHRRSFALHHHQRKERAALLDIGNYLISRRGVMTVSKLFWPRTHYGFFYNRANTRRRIIYTQTRREVSGMESARYENLVL